MSDCEIGRYCSIGRNCYIGGLGRHPLDHFSTSPVTFSKQNYFSEKLGNIGLDIDFKERSKVVIGHDVWIGTNSMILDGITIGTGAVIGANTVVAKDVPPYAVCYGSPMQVHRYRFHPNVIEELIESDWWNLDITEIGKEARERLISLCSSNASTITTLPKY
jgi:acetyltransferase-like isoleucine patch superfamily enzyme